MRWVSDDRVMKAAEGLMDARLRMREAWKILLNGHELPNVDPALDESVGERPARAETKARVNGNGAATNGSSVNGNGAAPQITHGSSDMDESLKERNTLASIGGKDVFEKCRKFMAADN